MKRVAKEGWEGERERQTEGEGKKEEHKEKWGDSEIFEDINNVWKVMRVEHFHYPRRFIPNKSS